MPPSLATAAASRAVDRRIAIPPCTIGIFAILFPILSSGSFKDNPLQKKLGIRSEELGMISLVAIPNS
jgi:hypothetical protein